MPKEKGVPALPVPPQPPAAVDNVDIAVGVGAAPHFDVGRPAEPVIEFVVDPALVRPQAPGVVAVDRYSRRIPVIGPAVVVAPVERRAEVEAETPVVAIVVAAAVPVAAAVVIAVPVVATAAVVVPVVVAAAAAVVAAITAAAP